MKVYRKEGRFMKRKKTSQFDQPQDLKECQGSIQNEMNKLTNTKEIDKNIKDND